MRFINNSSPFWKWTLLIVSIILIPVFFVLHGINENYGLIPFRIILKLFGIYCAIALSFYLISRLLLRDKTKALLFTYFLLFIYFFFGAIYDLIQKLVPRGLFTSYSFILPFLLLAVICIFILLKSKKTRGTKMVLYLKFLLVVLLLWETVSLFMNQFRFSRHSKNMLISAMNIPQPSNICPGDSLPDIYFIVLDGYSSSSCLKDEFNFDNSGIDSLFRVNQFYISVNSKSNYNVTPFSLSSTFGMDYLRSGIENGRNPSKLFLQAMRTFEKTALTGFFTKNGYLLKNFGCFSMDTTQMDTKPYFGNYYSRQIDQQTIWSRIKRDIWWNLSTRNLFKGGFRVPPSYRKLKEYHIYRNRHNWESLMNELSTKSNKPRFVYSHLMMPHEPFYLRADGTETSDTALIQNTLNLKEGYIEQVKYVNGLLKTLIPIAASPSGRPKVVIIEGDHGYRFYESKNLEEKEFNNLNAWYFSDGNYSLLYNNISPVNSFRVILNKYFCQNLPMLKDSSIFLANQKK